MLIEHISSGENPPEDINVLVEVPLAGDPVKYEIDKKSGAIFVDRFLHTSMFYPGNYGFIPHTLSGDGDPVDVLVVGRTPVVAGSVLRARPVGVLMMEDEAGQDEKIIAVPHTKLHSYYSEISKHDELPGIATQTIEHFFSHYKDLEVGKWVKVNGWGSPEDAHRMILQAIEREKAA